MECVEDKSTRNAEELEDGELRDTEDEDDSGIHNVEDAPDKDWFSDDPISQILATQRLKRRYSQDKSTDNIMTGKRLRRTVDDGSDELAAHQTENAYARLECSSCKGNHVDNENPAITASRRGHVPCLQVLLKNGVRLLERNQSGESVLSVAVERNHHAIVDLLIDWIPQEHPLATELTYGEFIDKAEHVHTSVIVKMWQKKFFKTDEDLASTVMFLFKGRFVYKSMDVLAELTDDKLVRRLSSLVHYDIPDKLDLLLTEKVHANRSEDNSMALYNACEFGRNDLVELLLESGADPNEYNPTSIRSGEKQKLSLPIQIAASKGNAGAVEVLLDYGAIVDMRTENEKVKKALSADLPYYLAHMNGHEEVAIMLLRKPLDKYYNTTLHWSVQAARFEEIPMLLLIGSNPNQRNKAKETALHLVFEPLKTASTFAEEEAWKSKVEKIVQCLLKNEAQANVRCEAGETPLYRASKKGCVAAVKLLLLKADDETLNPQTPGKHPLDAAREAGNNEIIHMLLEAGAKSNNPLEIEYNCNVDARDSQHHPICMNINSMVAEGGDNSTVSAPYDLSISDQVGIGLKRYRKEFAA